MKVNVRDLKRSTGFTIVELLIVIAIIGILATVTIVSYRSITQKAIAVSLKSDLTNASDNLKLYKLYHGSYPTSLGADNCPVPADADYCLKVSDGNSYTSYVSNGTTFGLVETNANGMAYNVTNNTDPATGPLKTVSSAPINLSATAGVNQITLRWSAPTSNGDSTITGYKVYRSATSGGEALLTTLGSVLTYINTGLASNTTYYYKVTAINEVGEGNLSSEATATTATTYTLTISAGANGTVNAEVSGVYSTGATTTITATPNATYAFSSWSGSTGCSGVASHTITMDGDKTCVANFIVYVDPYADWYSGIAATVLAGKHVSKTDIAAKQQYKTANTAVASPQGATGLDPLYPSLMSLVDPQANPGVNFSAYPAQNVCKAINGRLPNMQELKAIFADRASYGNNFVSLYYWSSTEFMTGYSYNLYFGSGGENYSTDTALMYVRCVAG